MIKKPNGNFFLLTNNIFARKMKPREFIVYCYLKCCSDYKDHRFYPSLKDIVLPQVTQGDRRPITDEDRTMILKTAKTHYAGTMVLTMLYCGLRSIEVRNLKWADLDFTNDLLTVTKSETKAGTGRKLPIPPQLKTALLEHKLDGTQRYICNRKNLYPIW